MSADRSALVTRARSRLSVAGLAGCPACAQASSPRSHALRRGLGEAGAELALCKQAEGRGRSGDVE